MPKKLKTILITSTAILGVLLLISSAQAIAVLDVEFQGEPERLFEEANFMPGEVVTRWVKVANNSGASERIAAEAINVSDNEGLGDVLNLEIKQGATTIYNESLATFFGAGEVYLSDLSNGANTQYDFSISFDSESNNPLLQGKSLGFDILVGFQGTEGGLPPGEKVMGGGGGGGTGLSGLVIHDDTVEVTDTQQHSVTIHWLTSHFSTSQVIYGADDEAHTLDLTDNIGSPPKYGYEYTTPEQDLYPKVTSHSITIDGLDAGTTYHFRAISYASPPTISLAYTFTTLPPREGEAEGQGLVQGENAARDEGGQTADNERTQGVLGEETIAGENSEGAFTEGREPAGEQGEEGGKEGTDEDIEGIEAMLGEEKGKGKFSAAVAGFFPDWNWVDIIWIILIVIAVLIVVFLVLKKRKKESRKL